MQVTIIKIKMINILIITDEIKFVCGVSNHIKNLITECTSTNNNLQFHILCGNIKEYQITHEFGCQMTENKIFLHRKRSKLNFILCIFYLIWFVIKNKIDIIHSHNHYSANISAIVSKVLKIKTLQTNHGIIEEKGKMKHFNADHYVVLSDRIKSYLIQNKNIQTKNIQIIKPGIQVKNKLLKKFDNSKLNILATSRFEKEKGLDIYISAANKIKQDYFKFCSFNISGEGSEEVNLKKINNRLGNHVDFVKPVKNINTLLEKTHVFVFPSRSATEGIPMIIIEALNNGCLVISSSFNGYKNIFPEKYRNLIFECDNIADLINKMEFTITNYLELSNYFHPFFDFIKQEYSLKKMAENHCSLYEKIIRGTV